MTFEDGFATQQTKRENNAVESTPEATGQDIVFPTLPHGVQHIGEIVAIIKAEIDKRQAEATGEENAGDKPETND